MGVLNFSVFRKNPLECEVSFLNGNFLLVFKKKKIISYSKSNMYRLCLIGILDLKLISKKGWRARTEWNDT